MATAATTTHSGSPGDPPEPSYLTVKRGFRNWIVTLDHKRIGVMYLIGIMTSFMAIAGSKSTSLAVVAPGIAEALLATAIGLVAAIPAVIAYNKLSSDAGKLTARMEGFADEFSAILSRQIDEKLPRT